MKDCKILRIGFVFPERAEIVIQTLKIRLVVEKYFERKQNISFLKTCVHFSIIIHLFSYKHTSLYKVKT